MYFPIIIVSMSGVKLPPEIERVLAPVVFSAAIVTILVLGYQAIRDEYYFNRVSSRTDDFIQITLIVIGIAIGCYVGINLLIIE